MIKLKRPKFGNGGPVSKYVSPENRNNNVTPDEYDSYPVADPLVVKDKVATKPGSFGMAFSQARMKAKEDAIAKGLTDPAEITKFVANQVFEYNGKPYLTAVKEEVAHLPKKVQEHVAAKRADGDLKRAVNEPVIKNKELKIVYTGSNYPIGVVGKSGYITPAMAGISDELFESGSANTYSYKNKPELRDVDFGATKAPKFMYGNGRPNTPTVVQKKTTNLDKPKTVFTGNRNFGVPDDSKTFFYLSMTAPVDTLSDGTAMGNAMFYPKGDGGRRGIKPKGNAPEFMYGEGKPNIPKQQPNWQPIEGTTLTLDSNKVKKVASTNLGDVYEANDSSGKKKYFTRRDNGSWHERLNYKPGQESIKKEKIQRPTTQKESYQPPPNFMYGEGRPNIPKVETKEGLAFSGLPQLAMDFFSEENIRSKKEQLTRLAEKKGLYESKEYPVVKNEVQDTISGYQEIGTAIDSYDKKNQLLSYRNQFDNESGFTYIPTGTLGTNKGEKYNNVEGVAHFLLDASVKKGKEYSHPYNKKFIESAKAKDEWIPAFTQTEEGVNLKYKKANQLSGSDIVSTPLRQSRFVDIDFNKESPARGFKSNVKEVKAKNSNFGLLYKDKNAYSRFSGGSVVFIFQKDGKTIVRDFAGSVNDIENEGNDIIKKYNIPKEQLTIGVHDYGSFSAKPKANNGSLSTDRWKGYNPGGHTGGALLIPKKPSSEQSIKWLESNGFQKVSVKSTTDGDTYKTSDGKAKRLANLSAPESSQPNGTEAGDNLNRILASGGQLYEKKTGTSGKRDLVETVILKDGKIMALDSLGSLINPGLSALSSDSNGQPLYPNAGISYGSNESRMQRNARLLKQGAKAKETRDKNQFGH